MTGWDWAAAYHKSLGIRVRREQEYRGEISSGLKVHTLRLIMCGQGNACAITHVPFHMPSGHEFRSRTGFNQWVISLPHAAQARTPVLVRVNRTQDWYPGNVMFIQRRFVSWYSQFSGLDECKRESRKLADSPASIVSQVMLRQMRIAEEKVKQEEQ